ncbi:flavodoxin family protein [Massilia sp. TS11]|uniref:flavodoxin family protein n=1 Tax=Massilia sp. TS11 TaxID=2908003 RepID=UPI001EDAC4A1|nr:flavodoxin family protein [Massilia sp. TS11]MCG2583833.1 flavodoxin family protein [Massilia sp. TS11]
MKKIAVIYHSGHGHTAHLAQHVVQGAASVAGSAVDLLRAEDLRSQPEALSAYDGLILGSPTYLGGVSGTFKHFMDATGGLWRRQQLVGKLAAGFTVSSLPAGDKQSTLLSLFVFCMQHGMMWVGNPFLPGQHQGVPYDEAVNRLGSWSGLMAQAAHGAPAEAFSPGDLRSAEVFGRNFSEQLQRMSA